MSGTPVLDALLAEKLAGFMTITAKIASDAAGLAAAGTANPEAIETLRTKTWAASDLLWDIGRSAENLSLMKSDFDSVAKVEPVTVDVLKAAIENLGLQAKGIAKANSIDLDAIVKATVAADAVAEAGKKEPTSGNPPAKKKGPFPFEKSADGNVPDGCSACEKAGDKKVCKADATASECANMGEGGTCNMKDPPPPHANKKFTKSRVEKLTGGLQAIADVLKEIGVDNLSKIFATAADDVEEGADVAKSIEVAKSLGFTEPVDVEGIKKSLSDETATAKAEVVAVTKARDDLATEVEVLKKKVEAFEAGGAPRGLPSDGTVEVSKADKGSIWKGVL